MKINFSISQDNKLSVWILNIFLMNRRYWCECYCQDSGSHELASILLEIVMTVSLYLSMGKSQESRWTEKKTSKWIKDVHILHKRHWKVVIS